MIQKKINKFDVTKEVTAVEKSHSYRSDEKRTSEFIGEIQAMTDNNPSKSTRSTARNLGMSVFLIRQIAHEDIQYFSYKKRNDKFLSNAMKNKRKDHPAKILNKFKHSLKQNTLLFF